MSDGSGSLPSPRLVRPCRSPGRTFEVSRRVTVSCSPPRGRSQQPGPRGLRSSLERGGISAVPVPSAPVGFNRPPLLGFVGVCTPVPFHRPHPRRSPSRGVATASDPSCTLESRSDLVVSHDLAGFLRRSPGFSPGFPSPFRATKDSRACCIPMPIVGFDAFLPPRPVEPAPGAWSLLTPFLAGHTDGVVPRIEVSYPPEGSPHLQP